MKKIALITGITILIDQIIKFVVIKYMTLNLSITVIDKFFSLTYVRNYGAAFSILNGNRFLLIFITFLALALIYFLMLKKINNNSEKIIYGILFGGILGNLIDRLINGYVIDYLDFNIFGYDFPIFNFADICIVISIGIILLMSIRGNLNEKHCSN